MCENYFSLFRDRRQLVSNLSIHQISAKYKQPGDEHLRSIWRGFKIPCHAPSESIFPSVLEKVDECEFKFVLQRTLNNMDIISVEFLAVQ